MNNMGVKSKMEENWRYILINGKSCTIQVKDPKLENGRLVDLNDIRPFQGKNEDDSDSKPTAELANRDKRNAYQKFFQKPFKNFIVLTGAGASMDVGGPSMWDLWQVADGMYKGNEDGSSELNGFKEIQKAVNYQSAEGNLEALLSRIEGFCKYSGDQEVKLPSGSKWLSEIKEELFEMIKTNCSISEPDDAFPHKIFLEKILQRKQTNLRVKVFTLNYDKLFEFAATRLNAILIDGFSYNFPRTFSGRYFDYDIVQREGSKLKEEDNFVQRVFHYHKLHGSVNWERNDKTGDVEINEKAEKPLMVYPREAKYEDSYEQPFFEMMARFQRNLRLNNDTLLLCIGYSFNDKHINAAIEEALNQNPGFRLAVVNPNFDDEKVSTSLKTIKDLALKTERVIMISEAFTDFADHFPEIQTYDDPQSITISLKNE